MITDKRWVIFDIDGVLSNPEHRLKHLECTPKDWDAFNSNCVNDVPFAETLELLRVIYEHGFYRIALFTGRDSQYEKQTYDWLRAYNIPYDTVMMRPEGDRRSDYEVKWEYLERARIKPEEVLCIFEDRKSVVEMWRKKGLRCWQNVEGNF